MNKERRKALIEISQELQELRDRIELLQEEEQEGFDNLPESLQQAAKGQAMERAAADMGAAFDSVDEALDALEGAIGEAEPDA